MLEFVLNWILGKSFILQFEYLARKDTLNMKVYISFVSNVENTDTIRTYARR